VPCLGDNQIAPSGRLLLNAAAVRVLDKYGNAVAGQLVTFAMGDGGGTITGRRLPPMEAEGPESARGDSGTLA
jgi:hypothetical protein